MQIKVVSFNVQHFRNYNTKEIDYDSFEELLKKINADIIGLNEVYGKGFDKSISKTQAEELASRLGYYCYFGKSTLLWFIPYGNAILSKYPLTNIELIKIPNIFLRRGTRKYERRSIIKASLIINSKPLTIMITHLGLNHDEQELGLNTIIENLPNKGCILMGDLNIDSHNNMTDVLNPYLNNTGDIFNNELMTWPSDNPYYKYDYIYTSKDLKIIDADILPVVLSDHRPYVALIEI